MTNQSMTTFPSYSPVADTHGDDFYMVDVDYVREWSGERCSATYYVEDWTEDSMHDNLMARGFEVVGTYVW